MEDVGHDYLIDLVSRSLFEKCPSDYEEEEEEEFIMHDLIHDVAQFAAGNICNVMEDGTDTQTDLRRTRHLFISKHVQTSGTQIMASHLRTFLCNYGLTIDLSDFFKKICYIRTLSLCSDVIEIMPACNGDLKHLCYLSLKFKRIKELPQSVSNLWNLQTLCLKGCDELQMVPCIESLGKLRHLSVGKLRYLSVGNDPYLPRRSTFLKEMPHGMGKLTSLQTLGEFVLAAGGGSRVRELGMLNNLRGILKIIGLKNVADIEDAKKAELNKKESLDKLYMEWGTCTDEDHEVDDITKTDVIEKLQPHTNIKSCGLYNYMGSKFPSWLGDPSFSNMVEIDFSDCGKCECLPPLWQLPSLKSLLISNMDGIKEVGLEFYGRCSSPFPSLTLLTIHDMESWEKWVHPPVDNKAFPILENLFIYRCLSLQGDLPAHLPSLKKIGIDGCGQLQFLELKNYSSSASHLGDLFVYGCKSIVSIRHIPSTLQSLFIIECEKLEYVKFDEQPANLSHGIDNEKGLKSEESIGFSPKASSLELPLLTLFNGGFELINKDLTSDELMYIELAFEGFPDDGFLERISA